MNQSENEELQVQEILHRWLESRDQGARPSPEIVCGDAVYLIPVVRQRIDALEALERDLGIPVTAGTPGLKIASSDETRTLKGAVIDSLDAALHAFAPPVAPSEVGRFGRYRIKRMLGQGGMGAVFLAFDERLGREVALKLILPNYAADKNARERFLREAKAAACISNDHVVTIFEADEVDGTPFIALQFLRGCSLADELKTPNRLTIPDILRIGREAALGLAAAHQLGIIHRDIKPANLWLECTGEAAAALRDNPGTLIFSPPDASFRVKVLDFGIAKSMVAEESTELAGSSLLIGTPAYMSPEQASGDKLDHRTDLFSLGSVLYRLCSGRLPFQGKSWMAMRSALTSIEPAPLRQLNAAVPQQLASLIHQMLSKQPDFRPASATEVADRLEAIAAQLSSEAPMDFGASKTAPSHFPPNTAEQFRKETDRPRQRLPTLPLWKNKAFLWKCLLGLMLLLLFVCLAYALYPRGL